MIRNRNFVSAHSITTLAGVPPKLSIHKQIKCKKLQLCTGQPTNSTQALAFMAVLYTAYLVHLRVCVCAFSASGTCVVC